MIGTVERAYQLAPECTTLDQVRLKLKQEGHERITEHLQGASIRKDLTKLLRRN